MKKRGTVLLVGVLLLCLCACGEKDMEVTSPPSVEPTTTATPTPTPPPTPTPTPPPTPTLPTVELSEDVELFQAFMRGESEAAVDEDFHDDYISGLADMELFTIKELLQKIEESTTDEGELAYTMTETLGGREMLVLSYASFADMGPYLYLVLGIFEDQVRLTYATEFGYRCYAELRQGLVFSGGGSGGAGAHYAWCGYIGEDGHYQQIYEGELLLGPWALWGTYDVFGEDIDWAEELWCDLVTTGEGKFYGLGAPEDTDPEKLALLRQYYVDQGYTEVDDAEAVIAAAEAAHGIDPDAPAIEDWTPWEITK